MGTRTLTRTRMWKIRALSAVAVQQRGTRSASSMPTLRSHVGRVQAAFGLSAFAGLSEGCTGYEQEAVRAKQHASVVGDQRRPPPVKEFRPLRPRNVAGARFA